MFHHFCGRGIHLSCQIGCNLLEVQLIQELTHPPAVPGKRVWVGGGCCCCCCWCWCCCCCCCCCWCCCCCCCCCCTVFCWHTRAPRARARAKHARKYWLIWRARASGARPHIYGREVREPTNEPKNHGIYDVFAASEKIKLKIRIAKKTKTLYFTMFLARRVPKLAFRKALKHRCLQCFGPPPKRKQRYVRCFLILGTPKWSRNNGIHDVFAIAKKVFLQNAGKQKVT